MKNTKELLMKRKDLPMLERAKKDAIKEFHAIKTGLANCEFDAEQYSKTMSVLAAGIEAIQVFVSEVDEAINSIEDEQTRKVLAARYTKGLCWEDVALDAGYTLSHVHRIHKKGLTALAHMSPISKI